MRITIDASSLLPPRTGVGTYTFNLVRGLLDLDPVNQYQLFFNSLRRSMRDVAALPNHPNCRISRWRFPGPWMHRAWKQYNWPPIEKMAGPADVVHAPAGILPPRTQENLVITIHDCYFMRHPEHCHSLGGLYLRDTLPKRIRECGAILCDSEFTRREALELFNLDPVRVRVVPLGVDPSIFHPITDEIALERVRRRWHLPMNFMLTVATLEPRKNLEGLLRAIAHLKEMMKEMPKLVCAGGEGFQSAPIRKLVNQLELQNDVLFTGFVDPDDLPAIYSQAMLVIVPSHYEGFGLTVLEAMACAAPVLASSAEALKETGGDAAHYTHVADGRRMADAIRALLSSESRRLNMKRRGLLRAARFSWRNTARGTLAVYEMVGIQS